MSKNECPIKCKDLTKDECYDRAEAFADKLIDMINVEIVVPHQNGEMSSSNAVFIASDALAKLAAMSIAGQLPPDKFDRIETLSKNYTDLVEGYMLDIIRIRRENGDEYEGLTPSAWDAKEGDPK